MKTTKRFLITTLLLCMAYGLSAQNNTQDVVYLKNGGIMRGSIIEFLPEKYVKIETIGGNIFVYQVNEIEKCVKEPEKKADLIYKPENNIELPNHATLPVHKDTAGIGRGYFGVFEMGMGISGGYMEGPLRMNLNFISGYRVNPWFAFGGGFGLRSFPGNDLYMPLFIDLRTNFLNKRTSPYLSLDGGYAFCLTHVNNGGFMLSPTLGVSVKMKKRTAINLGLSYQLQRTKAYYLYMDYLYYPYPQYNYYALTHTLSFQFGVSF